MSRIGRLFSLSSVVLVAAAACDRPGAAVVDPNTSRGPSVAASRSFNFTYETYYGNLPRDRNTIDIWVPLPWSDNNQSVSQLTVYSPYGGESGPDAEYGNRVFHMRSGRRGGLPIQITVRFRIQRQEVSFGDLSGKPGAPRTPPDNLERYLESDRLVPVDAETKALAAQIAKDKKSAADKARAVYDYVVGNIKYDKSGYGWGQGDLRYILTLKKGNSADIAAAFTGLARASNIPARFVTGFKIPKGGREGFLSEYHAWAEFWLDRLGWIPVDPAQAVMNPGSRESWFGRLDPDRIQFSVGRDVVLSPPQNGDPINFLLYPYAEGEGQPLGGAAYRFRWEEAPPEEASPSSAPAVAPPSADPNAAAPPGL